MILLGYFLALIAGVFLGLFGGGGSILIVPILVYLMGINPISATAYSLFIVGIASLFGSQQYIYKNQINNHSIQVGRDECKSNTYYELGGKINNCCFWISNFT